LARVRAGLRARTPARAPPRRCGRSSTRSLVRVSWAWILVQKYRHHLPLYRQQAIFARDGLFLPRQTLCDWTMGSAFHLAPIVLALKRLILASGVVQLDDTPVRCQGGKGQRSKEAHETPNTDGLRGAGTPASSWNRTRSGVLLAAEGGRGGSERGP
jgi:hypothetical protein